MAAVPMRDIARILDDIKGDRLLLAARKRLDCISPLVKSRMLSFC
jgi:hypothetical protein